MNFPQRDPSAVGYQEALDLGEEALERGLPRVAVSYLSHASSLRETQYALGRLAKAHRDLGELEAARSALEQALDLPGGEDTHCLIALVAVLCDLRDYESALPLAQRAAIAEPPSAAALTVAARCLREFAAVLGRSEYIDQSSVAAVIADAKALTDQAARLEPEAREAFLTRRRERRAGVPLEPLRTGTQVTSVDQPEGAVAETTAGESRTTALDEERPGPQLRPSLWGRLCRLFRGG